jgi:hypothetical protein
MGDRPSESGVSRRSTAIVRLLLLQEIPRSSLSSAAAAVAGR